MVLNKRLRERGAVELGDTNARKKDPKQTVCIDEFVLTLLKSS